MFCRVLKIVVADLRSAVEVNNDAADPNEVLRIIDDMGDSAFSLDAFV